MDLWPSNATLFIVSSMCQPRAGGCERDTGIVTVKGRRPHSKVVITTLIRESFIIPSPIHGFQSGDELSGGSNIPYAAWSRPAGDRDAGHPGDRSNGTVYCAVVSVKESTTTLQLY